MRLWYWFKRLCLLIGGLVFFAVIGVTGVVQLENHDPFCTACHTEPEVTYYQRTQTAASDLASLHAVERVRCIDCHSGEGWSGRQISLKQGTQDLFKFMVGHYSDPSQTTAPMGDIACTKCHAESGPVASASLIGTDQPNSHYHFQSFTAVWRDQVADERENCVQCHQAHSNDLTEEMHFRDRSTVNDACLSCHNAFIRARIEEN